MPIYEYKCISCGEDFEKLVFADKAPNCPKCESVNVQKKLSLFGMSGVERPFAGTPSCNKSSCSGGSCSSCG